VASINGFSKVFTSPIFNMPCEAPLAKLRGSLGKISLRARIEAETGRDRVDRVKREKLEGCHRPRGFMAV